VLVVIIFGMRVMVVIIVTIFGMLFVIMLIVRVFGMRVVIMRVVIFIRMIVMTFFRVVIMPMIVVVIFAFAFSAGGLHGTGCIGGHDKKIERRRERGHCGINRSTVCIAFGDIFKPNDIGAGGFEFHCDGRAIDGDIEHSDAVFMRVKRAGFFRKCGHGSDERDKGDSMLHGKSVLFRLERFQAAQVSQSP